MLLQIAIGWLIINCDKILLQIPTTDLLQIATSLLQIAIDITNWDKFISNCDSYYKLRRLLQIRTEQWKRFKESLTFILDIKS